MPVFIIGFRGILYSFFIAIPDCWVLYATELLLSNARAQTRQRLNGTEPRPAALKLCTEPDQLHSAPCSNITSHTSTLSWHQQFTFSFCVGIRYLRHKKKKGGVVAWSYENSLDLSEQFVVRRRVAAGNNVCPPTNRALTILCSRTIRLQSLVCNCKWKGDLTSTVQLFSTSPADEQSLSFFFLIVVNGEPRLRNRGFFSGLTKCPNESGFRAAEPDVIHHKTRTAQPRPTNILTRLKMSHPWR